MGQHIRNIYILGLPNNYKTLKEVIKLYGGMELTNQDKTLNDIICRRYEMVQARTKHNQIVKSILKEYEVSRPTFYRYLNRFKKHGIFGLRDLSRAPKYNANKTPRKDEEELIRLHNKYPYFSSYELSEICGLSYKAIQRIRKRNGLKNEYRPKDQKKTLLKRLKKKYQKTREKESKDKGLQTKKNRK